MAFHGSAALRLDDADSAFDDQKDDGDRSDMIIGSSYYATLAANVRHSLVADALKLSITDLLKRGDMLIAASRAGSVI